MVNGEAIRALAREYDVQPSAIRAKLSTRVTEIKLAAETMVKADMMLERLPISAQISARSLADHLLAISINVARGARDGSETYSHLTALAHKRAHQITDELDDGLKTSALSEVQALTKVANDALAPALSLLAANKNSQPASEPPTPPPDRSDAIRKRLRDEI